MAGSFCPIPDAENMLNFYRTDQAYSALKDIFSGLHSKTANETYTLENTFGTADQQAAEDRQSSIGGQGPPTSNTNDRVHAKQKSKVSLPCPKCPKVLSSKSILKRHFNENHAPIDMETFSCPDSHCSSRPFKRKSQLSAHLKQVHIRKPQPGNEVGDKIKNYRASKIQGVKKVNYEPPGIISLQNATMSPAIRDPVPWNFDSGDPSSIQTDTFGDVNRFSGASLTGDPWTLENESLGHFENPSTALQPESPLNFGLGDLQDICLTSQMHDEGAETNENLDKSDDQIKCEMISALQEKYAELGRIDEQIRILEELKANRSKISQDIEGLDRNYLELVQGLSKCRTIGGH
ncbi:hypothetical protein MMC07_001943 [Pseudocyphellaria aurata]|nr:hypothetical protein [Pseudocyphellaria aurata]